MLKSKLDELISESLKNKDSDKLKTLRLIKTEFVKAEKDGTVLDDVAQETIMRKMVKQREDSVRQYLDAGREDLAAGEKTEIEIINSFLPELPSDEEVIQYIETFLKSFAEEKQEKLTMKYMKDIMSNIKGKYPSADGKLISQTVQNWIKMQ